MLRCTHDGAPYVEKLVEAKRHASLLTNFLLDDCSYYGVRIRIALPFSIYKIK